MSLLRLSAIAECAAIQARPDEQICVRSRRQLSFLPTCEAKAVAGGQRKHDLIGRAVEGPLAVLKVKKDTHAGDNQPTWQRR